MIKLGFLGTGWIGRNRMAAMIATGQAQAVREAMDQNVSRALPAFR